MQDTLASPHPDSPTPQQDNTNLGTCTEALQPEATAPPIQESQLATTESSRLLKGAIVGAVTGAIGGVAKSAGGTVTSAMTVVGTVSSKAMQTGASITDAAKSASGTVTNVVTGAVETVNSKAMQASASISEAAKSVGGTVANTVTGATESVGSTAIQAGGAIGGKAVGMAMTVGNVAMQATDGLNHALDLIANNPHLKELTNTIQVDWFLPVINQVDIVQAETRVRDLQQKYPQESSRQIARRIMLEKALYVGSTGFASSLVPGLAATMFTVDLALTMALQAEMIYQIAAAYGLDLQEASRKGEVLAILGMTLGGSSALNLGLGFARNIPIAGAVIGASSNAAMLYALGYAACRFYEKKFNCAGSSAEDWEESKTQAEADLKALSSQQIIMDQIFVHIVMASHPDKTLLDLLPELQTLNLSSEFLETIQTNLESFPSLEQLLSQLNQDFGAYLIAQCYKVAYADGVITEQEAAVIERITQRFSTINNAT